MQESSMDANTITWKVSWGTGYLHSLKIYLNKLLMNYKGKKGTFTVEKSGGHQVIKVNLTSDEISQLHDPLSVVPWQWDRSSYLVSSSKTLELREFSDDLVVRILGFHCMTWIQPLVQELRSHKPNTMANKQANKQKHKTQSNPEKTGHKPRLRDLP